jgi:hypothetical protein
MPDKSTADTQSSASSFSISDRTSDLWENSPAAQSLKRLQENSRVKYIVLAVPADACPACQGLAGTYPKDKVPRLPIELCSHSLGCRSNYMPYLDEIYP